MRLHRALYRDSAWCSAALHPSWAGVHPPEVGGVDLRLPSMHGMVLGSGACRCLGAHHGYDVFTSSAALSCSLGRIELVSR